MLDYPHMKRKDDINKELVRCGKLLYEGGFAIGSGGNLSVRDGGHIIIKRQGVDLSKAKTTDYLRISIKDAEKGPAGISSETPLHLASYAASPETGAVIHVHSPVMVAVAEKTRLLKSNSYEFDCVMGGDIPVVPFIKPGTQALAEAVASKVKSGANAVLMARHGAVCVGHNIEETYVRVLALERASLTFLYLSA